MGNCVSAIRRLPVVISQLYSSSSLPFLYSSQSGYALQQDEDTTPSLATCSHSLASYSPDRLAPRRLSSSPTSAHFGGRVSVLLCGPQRSGKTALLYRAKLSAFILTLPTQEVTKESFQIPLGPEGFLWRIDVWDSGKRGPQDLTWREVLQQCNAVVFVVDSVDRRKLDQARSDFLDLFYEEHFVIQPQIRFLIFCTKQDSRSALRPPDVEAALDLPADVKQRCAVMGCSAMSGDGVRQGLEWLAGAVWLPLRERK
eukprot:GHVS01078634.1.p1 GENE.GHVS01078634.1~~GHVS01078634.1.p1  ORF type:complete len:256 (+),score=27.06 GHVS01078634.1:189-956(+)